MDKWGNAATLTLRDNGGTFTGQGERVFHGRGFYVGGRVMPHRTPVYNRSIIADMLHQFAWTNAPYLESESVYVGTWIVRGTLYVDCVDWVDERSVAEGLCRERGELAYFDCRAGREVYV